MRKTLQLGSLCLLLLFHFNMSSAGATGKTSLNLHKQSTQVIIDWIPTLFHHEADKTKEKMKALTEESELVIELEIAAVIMDLKNYHKQFESELVEVEREQSFLERLFSYEKEKEERIRNEINIEITDYLANLLFNQ